MTQRQDDITAPGPAFSMALAAAVQTRLPARTASMEGRAKEEASPRPTADLMSSITELRSAANVQRDENLALSVGRTIPLGSLDAFGLRIAFARDLGDGFDIAKLLVESLPFGLRLEDEPSVHARRVFLRIDGPGGSGAGILSELLLIILREWMKGLHPSFDPVVSVGVKRQSSTQQPRIETLMGCPVSVSTDAAFIEFDGFSQSLPAPNHDPLVCAFLDRQLDRSNEDRKTQIDFVRDATEAVVRNLSTGRPNIASTASAMAISTRTLQRKLQKHGLTFQDLLDLCRKEEAIRLLPRAPVSEIAYSLGYSDPAGFTRAFRRWTGTAPKDFLANGRRSVGGDPSHC